MPTPPMKRKNENVYGSCATADPTAETLNRIPTQSRTFLLPYLSVGIPPKSAPTTVPHNAIDITNNPWNQGEISVVCQTSLMGWLAPEITTVSKPKINPANAAMIEIPNVPPDD